jgi:hypothetical protein
VNFVVKTAFDTARLVIEKKLRTSELYRFICQCLLMDFDPAAREEVCRQITAGKVPWEEFVWTGSSHYVLPALYTAFRRNNLLTLLPEELVLHLEHIHSLNFKRNLQILEQCRTIGTSLNHKGIEPLFLKGAGFLLSGMYYDLGDRIMEDIDILVPEKDLQKSMEYLFFLGYMPGKNEHEEEKYEGHHHLPPLICKGQAAPVEIHRLPVHTNYSDKISVESMFDNRMPSKEIACWLPSVIDSQLLIFYHEYHAARGYLSSMPSIKGMYDFYLLSKSCPPDPVSLQSGRYRKSFRKFIYVTAGFFNVPDLLVSIETPSLKRYRKREIFLLNHPGVNGLWHDYVYAFVYLGGLSIKSIYSKKSRKLMLLKLKKWMTG